jgi:hypothetical protein
MLQIEGKIYVYRRDRSLSWLRPYDNFLVGTWNFHIKRVNKMKRPKKEKRSGLLYR